MSRTAICTWFVSDDGNNATLYPQLGMKSDTPEAKKAYWRCIVSFYASSMAVNNEAQHIFFTNTDMPIVDGVDIERRFADWSIKVVKLPITFRLNPGDSKMWGNQFYIFDVMNWLSGRSDLDRAIVLDSDVIWISAVEPLAEAIDEHGALTYLLDYSAYAPAASINGSSRQDMALFAKRHGDFVADELPYSGGEIYAATILMTKRLMARARELWPHVLEQGPDAPREEAHFLSILYALEGVQTGTANRFISRMWTTFKHNTLSPDQKSLMLWHLPSEKLTGFHDLFRHIAANVDGDPRRDPDRMGLTYKNYARVMGFPRRNASKLVRDAARKVRQKVIGRVMSL